MFDLMLNTSGWSHITEILKNTNKLTDYDKLQQCMLPLNTLHNWISQRLPKSPRSEAYYAISQSQESASLWHVWSNENCKLICTVKTYRHSIARIFPIHELYFHCNVTGWALTVSKVQALWVHIQQVPTHTQVDREREIV